MHDEARRRLLINLETTCEVYARLLDVAKRKQQHIMHNEVNALREDIQEEEILATGGVDLNTEREQLHRKCSDLLAPGAEADTLDRLCRHMTEPWHTRFRDVRARLKQTVRQLHEANQMNAVLVNNSIELMNGLLAALFDTEPVGAYAPRGKRTTTELPIRTLDARA